MKFNFSLKWMFASVAVAAIGAAALVNATEVWSQVMFSVAFVMLLSAILAAMYTGRGFYTGFSLFAGAYWLLVVPPAWGNFFAGRLPTWPVSEYVYERISREEPARPERGRRDLGTEVVLRRSRQQTFIRPPRAYFRSVAQFCWVILVGLLGGTIGTYIKAASTKSAP